MPASYQRKPLVPAACGSRGSGSSRYLRVSAPACASRCLTDSSVASAAPSSWPYQSVLGEAAVEGGAVGDGSVIAVPTSSVAVDIDVAERSPERRPSGIAAAGAAGAPGASEIKNITEVKLSSTSFSGGTRICKIAMNANM